MGKKKFSKEHKLTHGQVQSQGNVNANTNANARRKMDVPINQSQGQNQNQNQPQAQPQPQKQKQKNKHKPSRSLSNKKKHSFAQLSKTLKKQGHDAALKQKQHKEQQQRQERSRLEKKKRQAVIPYHSYSLFSISFLLSLNPIPILTLLHGWARFSWTHAVPCDAMLFCVRCAVVFVHFGLIFFEFFFFHLCISHF